MIVCVGGKCRFSVPHAETVEHLRKEIGHDLMMDDRYSNTYGRLSLLSFEYLVLLMTQDG